MNERLRNDKGHYLSKLTNAERMAVGKAKVERQELRERLSELTDRALAKRYGISTATIYLIPEYRTPKQLAELKYKKQHKKRMASLKSANPWAVL